ncbi:DUF2177 family protein [Mongoliimonas terrestris]|uniref:DUF2177 family protein n=1 Tax=Mongoliimonas terrestris TaxID=1709001 RepID=UPI00094978D8|nr:DUF2177 family protein [Mongoliimonas terrestris]
MTYLAAYGAAAAVFLVVDGLWLGVVARRFYADQYGEMLRPKPRLGAAAAFYLGYLAALIWFAVLPSEGLGAGAAALQGALFGAACYGTYHFTNRATLHRWPIPVMVVDIAWGAAVSAAASAAAAVAAAAVG